MSALRRPVVSAVWALLLAAGMGCARHHPRVVLIGLDGADWAVVDQLAAQGGMRTLTGLRERGAWGPLETLPDIELSPAIWTSIATGTLPTRHGVGGFMVEQPDGSRVPVRSVNRRTEALWTILAQRGRRAAVVGWWATCPAEDVGSGVVVSDALGVHGFGVAFPEGGTDARTYPPDLVRQVGPMMPAPQQIGPDFGLRFFDLAPGEYRRQMFHPGRQARPDVTNPIHLFQLYAATAQGYTAITERLLASRRDDLTMVYYEQVDSLSHLFMRFAPPRLEGIDDASFAAYHRVVTQWYQYQDDLIARLLGHVDLDHTVVVVVSDHGFKSGERRIASSALDDVARAVHDHEQFGIFVAAGPGIKAGLRVEGLSVLDVAPTVLYCLGLPVARDMDGTVPLELFDPALVARRPVEYVASYARGSRPVAPAAPPGWNGEEAERGLETLGYLARRGAAPDRTAVAGDATPGQAPASSPEVLDNLGQAHLKAGEREQAAALFRQALALDPRNANALLGLAAIARDSGRDADAEHYVRRAVQLDPSSAAALSRLAEIERDRGRLAESLRLYDEALRLEPQPFVYLGLGDSLYRAGRVDEAAKAFEAALAMVPDSFEANYDLGVVLTDLHRTEEAVAHYEAAVAHDRSHPKIALALNNLALLYLEQHKRDAAEARLREAVRLDPRHVESRFNLAGLLQRSGRHAEAIALLEETVNLAPNLEAANVALGLAYLEAGREEDAAQTLRVVHRLYPDNWVGMVAAAADLARSGDLTGSRRLVAAAVARGGDEAKALAGRFEALRPLAGALAAGSNGERAKPGR